MKKNNLFNIRKLYLYFYLNKASLIILGVSFIFLIIIFLYNSGYPFSSSEYLEQHDAYLKNYFLSNLNIISILNAFLFVILGTLEITYNSNNFDSLFISSIGRTKLILLKLSNYLKIVVVYSSLEFILLFIIPLSVYVDFSFSRDYFNIFFTYMSLSVYVVFFTVLLVYLLNNYLASFLMFLVIILSNIFSTSQNTLIKDISNFIMPSIDKTNLISISLYNGYLYIWTLITIISLFIVIIYRHRDVKII